VGKHFSVNYMLAKESVSRRAEREDGVSYAEFSYMLLQAYDFLVLHDRLGSTLQVGGSDQWGNITAGIDLVSRTRGAQVHGLCTPLVVSSNGTKFGNTEAGAIWLDPGKTSPFRFYQFWLNTPDADVDRYLRFFTFLSRDEIEGLRADTAVHPEARGAQRRLADEVTCWVHGEDETARARRATAVLFGAEVSGLAARDLLDIFADADSTTLPRLGLSDGGIPVIELVHTAGLAGSRSEARRLVEGGGVYLNNRRVADASRVVGLADAVEGQLCVLRRGPKEYRLVLFA
jgi:tyrosyl-tRNA synthetase